jgi:hypothetical protein
MSSRPSDAALVEADEHRRADGRGRERLAGAGGVAAQEVALVARGPGARDRAVVEGADPGRRAVDRGAMGDHGLERVP